MEFHCILFVILMSLLCSSQASNYYVGGPNGWVLNPSENLNHWAERNRFKINDTLIFKYEKGSDSVLVVNKEDYDKCDTSKPIISMNDGESMFKFDRSGPFYFISGNPGSCQKGQKLITIVLSMKGQTGPNPPPQHMPSPSPPAAGVSSDFQAPAPTPSSSPSFASASTAIALISAGASLLVTVVLA